MSTHSARVKARGQLPEAISPLLPQVGLRGEHSLQLVSCWPLHSLTASLPAIVFSFLHHILVPRVYLMM